MVYKKKGIPEENEIVICTVKKILYHSVFVTLDEYENLEGMLHISEIAPGRIRNIRDYVREGKKLVCKILRARPEKKQFDLSLRRVSLAAQKKKNEDYKQEAKAEKILELAAAKIKKSLKDAYEEVGFKIIEKYDLLNSCFQEVATEGEKVLKDLKIPTPYIKPLLEIIKERIKPPEVTTTINLKLKSSASNGIEIIKKAIKKGQELAKKEKYDIKLSYVGAPKYKLNTKASDYKTAEEAAQKIAETIVEEIEKEGGSGEYTIKK